MIAQVPTIAAQSEPTRTYTIMSKIQALAYVVDESTDLSKWPGSLFVSGSNARPDVFFAQHRFGGVLSSRHRSFTGLDPAVVFAAVA